jgi:membrane protein
MAARMFRTQTDRESMATSGSAADRGRSADRPSEIPAAGWRDILWRVWAQIGEDKISILAAGVAFYSLLAIFPAITAFVSLFGLVADPGQVQAQFAALKGIIPQDAWSILDTQLTAVASARASSLGIGAIVGLGVALWSAGAGVRAMMIALNNAYHERERRSAVVFYLTAFLFTIGIVALAILSLAVIVAVPVALSFVDLGPIAGVLIKLLPWLVLAVFVTIALGALYRYGASRAEPKTRWVSWGALVATLLWIAASILFSIYVSNFASYNETYGTLGAVVALLMWLWLSAFIVLLGAELNAEMEHQTAQDTTTGGPKPMGQRGAYVADTVGEVPRGASGA